MDYLLISDGLWYAGHILSGMSMLFAQTNNNLAIAMVTIGQFITIISRPIGRINNHKEGEEGHLADPHTKPTV